MNVAYVMGVAPQPESPFTHDEIAAAAELTHIEPVAVMLSEDAPGWSGPVGRWSAAAAISMLLCFAQRPLGLGGALMSLIGASGWAPYDLAVAVRAAMAACFLAQRVQPDVIHAQFAGPAAATAFVWSRLSGVPFSVRAHAYDIYTPYRWLLLVLRECSAVIVISEHGRRRLASLGVGDGEVVHVGVPTREVDQRTPRDASTPFRVLSVGALTPKKGHHIAIDAINELALRGRDIQLDIVGTGPLESELRERAALTRRVTFSGWVPNAGLRSTYARYDLYLMTSQLTDAGDSDGIPVALMEAMAARLPVLATAVGGIEELVENGVTGQVAETDPKKLADQIEAIMDDYRPFWRLTEAAYSKVAADFDLARQSRALVAIWERIADRGANSAS